MEWKRFFPKPFHEHEQFVYLYVLPKLLSFARKQKEFLDVCHELFLAERMRFSVEERKLVMIPVCLFFSYFQALSGNDISIFVYGNGLNMDTEIKMTTAKGEFGSPCKSEKSHVQSRILTFDNTTAEGTTGKLFIPSGTLPKYKDKTFYFCMKQPGEAVFMHQGTSSDIQITLYELILPLWFMVILIVVLLCLSGLFSGLNLGLMALDQTELKIVQNTGSEKEKNYANKIAPIRAHGNFLLCSLLLGNVLVNNTLTILLDTLTSGLVAVIGATMGIVVFGEIIPQAICSRHGLAVGAYTIWMTKFFMLLTFPLSYPISRLLDVLLGAEIGTVYDKKKLIELLRVTDANNDLEKEEVDIVTGALVYKDKTVKHIMTKMEDIYMLPIDAFLDFDTVAEIREQGYSRIPVYEGDKKNIMHILFAKDLMFVDPDDQTPIQTVCDFYNNEVNFVFHDTPLNVMFNEFKSGEKGHMAFVQEINDSGEGDPYYETVGLVTLEDIIEEIIQQEIVDETDVITDNRTKKRRKRGEGYKMREGNFTNPNGDSARKLVYVTPQMSLAVFQYLTTTIEPFKTTLMNPSVLKRLLTLDIFREVKMKKDKSKKCDEAESIIIHKGKPIDFFILIIEGRVEVNIGCEELVFESGPFTYFGIQSLNNAIMDASPSSPSLAHGAKGNNAAAIQNSQSNAELPHSASGGPRGSLRKASTHNVIELNPNPGSSSALNRRHQSVTAQDITVPSRVGSSLLAQNSTGAVGSIVAAVSNNSSLASFSPFVPDYTVKAVSDLIYLKVKRSTYLTALKASLLSKKAHQSGEPDQGDLDRFLERVTEDEASGINGPHDMIMMNSPNLTIRSPENNSLAKAAKEELQGAAQVLKSVTVGESTPLDASTDLHKKNNGGANKYLLDQIRAKQASWEDTDSSAFNPTLSSVAGGRDSPPFIDVVSNVASVGGTGSNGPPSLPSGAGESNVIAVKENNGGGGGGGGSSNKVNNSDPLRTSLLDNKLSGSGSGEVLERVATVVSSEDDNS